MIEPNSGVNFDRLDPIKGAADFLRVAVEAADQRLERLATQRADLDRQEREIAAGKKALVAALRALDARLPKALRPPPASVPSVSGAAGVGGRTMEAVERVLATKGRVTADALVAHANIQRNSANTALSLLAKQGILRRIGAGVYARANAAPVRSSEVQPNA